ncbi:hypothetical protein GCM10023238_12380 [Streptomyces heliomycini]
MTTRAPVAGLLAVTGAPAPGAHRDTVRAAAGRFARSLPAPEWLDTWRITASRRDPDGLLACDASGRLWTAPGLTGAG